MLQYDDSCSVKNSSSGDPLAAYQITSQWEIADERMDATTVCQGTKFGLQRLYGQTSHHEFMVELYLHFSSQSSANTSEAAL